GVPRYAGSVYAASQGRSTCAGWQVASAGVQDWPRSALGATRISIAPHVPRPSAPQKRPLSPSAVIGVSAPVVRGVVTAQARPPIPAGLAGNNPTRPTPHTIGARRDRRHDGAW